MKVSYGLKVTGLVCVWDICSYRVDMTLEQQRIKRIV